MIWARATIHPDFTVAPIHERLYGAFLERLGRAIYGGIFEPGHPSADGKGFRGDVLGLVRALQVPIVRYPGGTRWSDLRRRSGHADPHDVRVWCLGNEMDGPWQLGQKTAYHYGRLAQQTARAMRAFDPTLELVACGSSHDEMPTWSALGGHGPGRVLRARGRHLAPHVLPQL